MEFILFIVSAHQKIIGDYQTHMPIFRDTGQVTDGIYLIDTFIWEIAKQHAIYVIQYQDHNVIIDTGIKNTLKTVLSALERWKITSADYILVTHSHIDHCGALRQFAKIFPEATIGIPALAQDLLEHFQHKAEKFALSNPILELKKNTLIKLNDHSALEVIETPGHLSDHLSFYEKERQILFVGDACGAHHLGAGFSRPTAYAPDFQHDAYIDSLLKFRKIKPWGVAIASYGFATDQDAIHCIETAISDFYNWKQAVLSVYQETHDEDIIASLLLEKFGRSPGEINENRSARWVHGIMRGIARGFINSLGLNKI